MFLLWICHAASRQKGISMAGVVIWCPFFYYFPKISPCPGRRSPSAQGSGGRGSPGRGAGRSLMPRPTKLGPWEAAGRAGQEHARGDRSAPRYKILNNGNAIFVTTQSPKMPINAVKCDLCMSTEGLPLKPETKIQNPASSEPTKRPFLGDRLVPPYCMLYLW